MPQGLTSQLSGSSWGEAEYPKLQTVVSAVMFPQIQPKI